MKKLFFAVFALQSLVACNLVADWNKTGSDSTGLASADSNAAFVPVRDLSITAANAYSDLFLDSNALETYIRDKKVPDSMAREMRHFYLARNYQYAWMTSNGFTEEGRGFHGQHMAMDSAAAKTPMGLDTLMQKDTLTISAQDTAMAQAELSMTEDFIRFAKTSLSLDNPAAAYYFVPAKKTDPMQLADSLLNRNADSVSLASNQAHTRMKQQLAVYYNAAKNGGWTVISAAGFRKGAASPAVRELKKRLQLTQDYTMTDTSDVYTDSLASAVKDVQARFGLKPTGIATDSLVTMLNVPAQQRVEQLVLNMRRMAWLPRVSDSNIITVNIPAYMLYVTEGSRRVMEMPVIVGKEGTHTTMFTGQINEIVFSPAWNIPQSIVRDEIMPKMKADNAYLKRNNIEIVNQGDSIPRLRQLPGKGNPLGRVKFLFPNSYDIYLHDTPDRQLFARKDRALSHGCIRVSDAPSLAAYLLRDNPEWSTQKIEQAMNGKEEQHVKVSRQTPVRITYLTAWVDENGKMNFRDDVYGHDQRTAARYFVRTSSQL
ncbi:MAG TPA: L,D-transpeptidase family protein [Flavisolibacter sp.]